LSTHILPEVEATCDRILIINRGRIVANGTPELLRQQATGGELLRVRIEDGEPESILNALNQLTTVEKATAMPTGDHRFEVHSKPGQSSRRDIFRICTENGWVLTESIPLETRLEDI